MTDVAREQNVEKTVRLRAIFSGFLIISLCSAGGGSGIIWARRIVVETRRWISDAEFGDIISLCQLMPGPNIVGISVCVGEKIRGMTGAAAALCGFLVIPWTVGLSFGLLYLECTHLTVLKNILGGIAPTAAGLLVATGLRLLTPHLKRRASLMFAVISYCLIVFVRVPLPAVIFGLVPLSIMAAGIDSARAR
jgi:chromate transporter